MIVNRRLFLKGSALIGCSLAAHPFMSTVTMAAAPGENRLVVIVLRGAMDGLDAVQPWGDPLLRKLRQNLSVGPQGGATDLDGFYALHRELAPLLPLWKAGQLGFVHAVSTPYRDERSHFDGQSMLEAGTANDMIAEMRKGGWLNRLLTVMPDPEAETAYAIGNEDMLILSGEAYRKSWAPNTKFTISPQAQLLLDRAYEDDPLFRKASAEAATIAANSPEIAGAGGPTAAAAALGGFAADRMNGRTRIAAFSLSGFDSHAGQEAVLGRALANLSAAVLALRDGLGANWDKTTVLAMTEFGRTVRENGSDGTDHGTAGAMLMAGGAIKGGKVFGKWPGLGEGNLYADRDLLPTRDVRAYAAWAMAGLFGIPRNALETVVFPALDMGTDPGILA
ncbi:DUF1501 domain-containing protein [Paracoccus pacificus]|uniref:DUF1501 domain-containing protein n=1 Tax=Paracoccus pacificus TaxID=1463598 RepID=A0ABW4RBX1_9RHOB